MLNSIYDVIIVGGGPAGATAARYLAQQGVHVVLIDKEEFPRVKPCGGGLTYRILTRFPHLKDAIERIVLNRPRSIHFYSPNLSCIRYTHYEPLSLMIRRCDFDTMLLEQCRFAGATVVTSAPVNNIAITPGGVKVTTIPGKEFRAKAIIGADGANSLVAKQTGLRHKWQREQFVVSISSEIPGAALDLQDHSTIQLFYGLEGIGYGWVFPKKKYVNLGILGFLSRKQDRNLKELYEQFIHILKLHGKISGDCSMSKIRGGMIPVKGVNPKTQTDRVLLCGDAAGFVNGVTGEGIYYAMVSADLAAKALIQAFEQNDFSESTLACYQKAWQEEIGDEINQSIHIQQKLLSNLHFIDILTNIIETHDGMKKIFMEYFMGEIAYSTLKRYLMLHFPVQYLKLKARKIFQ